MYELKKNGKVFTSKFVWTGPSSYKKKKNLPGRGLTEVEKHCSSDFSSAKVFLKLSCFLTITIDTRPLMTKSITSVGARLQACIKIGDVASSWPIQTVELERLHFWIIWLIFFWFRSTMSATTLKNTHDTGYGLIARLCSISSWYTSMWSLVGENGWRVFSH